MSTSPWQIGPLDGPWQDLAALGVTNLVRRRASAALDTATFTVQGRDVDATTLYPYGTVLKILRAGAAWFVGRVTRTPASADPRAHRHTYELGGPWWHLEHLVYQQPWMFRGGTTTALLSKLILGQALDGSARTSGQVIADALDYAIAAGAPFQRGVVLDGFNVPLDQVSDVTCAEVIRKMLRWHPDAVLWFDYSTDPLPTVHVRARGELTAAALPFGGRTVRIGDITRHDELYAPAVVIHYETTGTDDGQVYTDVVTDAAPEGATGMEFGAVVLTIPLHDASTATVSQSLVTRPIHDDVADAGLLDYLKLKDPALVTLDDDSVTSIDITTCARRMTDPAAVEPDLASFGATRPVTHDLALPNELVQGAVTPWMTSQYGIEAQQHTIDYEFTYTTTDGTVHGPFGRSVNLTATSATLSLYDTLTNDDPGEDPPVGLAANYLASLASLQWSGSVVIEEAFAGTACLGAGLGNVLNITGSRNAQWVTMNAPVVEETVEAATGRMTLLFGPARHLSPQDLVARLQTTRPGGSGGRQGVGAAATEGSGQRTSGRPAGAGDPSFQNPLHTPTGGVSALPPGFVRSA